MNVLIVDDDAYVLEALTQKMDWESLGIENVYTAYNVKRAKRIVEDIPIHIIVCDIEMPKKNGFALLKWIRERNLIIQFIFLTSYAEFDYAKKAIELRSFAYCLKPIAYDELAGEIKRAVKAEQSALEAVNYEKIYTYWSDSEKNRKDMFWSRVCLNEDYYRDADELWQDAVKLGVGYDTADMFVPFAFRLHNYDHVVRELGRGMLEWTFRNIADEVFDTPTSCIQGFGRIQSMEWMVIIQQKDEARETIYGCAQEFCDKIRTHFKCDISCIMGNTAAIEGIGASWQDVSEVLFNNVVPVNEIYVVRNIDFSKDSYQPPDFTLWESFFNEDREQMLLEVVDDYINHLSVGGRHSKKVLHSFVMDCIQMISSELRQRNILLHSLGDGSCFETKKIAWAIQSFEDARKYLRDVIHISMESVRDNRENMSVVDQIKDYIDHNLEKDITRESLAELVYLNPDYLARIFKKEAGESLGAWLVRRRIERARELLEKTSDPINTIALKVGYDNFSYFSKVFKDMVGVTPKEYRKSEDTRPSAAHNGIYKVK